MRVHARGLRPLSTFAETVQRAEGTGTCESGVNFINISAASTWPVLAGVQLNCVIVLDIFSSHTRDWEQKRTNPNLQKKILLTQFRKKCVLFRFCSRCLIWGGCLFWDRSLIFLRGEVAVYWVDWWCQTIKGFRAMNFPYRSASRSSLIITFNRRFHWVGRG